MNPDLSAEYFLSSPSLPLVSFASRVPNARIKLDEFLRTGEEQAVFLCWIEADSFDTVEGALDAEPSIGSWSLLETTTDRRLYRLRTTRSTDVQVPIGAEFIQRGATPMHARIASEGWHMRARFPDRETLTAFRESCQKRGMSFVLEQLYQPTAEREGTELALASLTPKQREALLLAHDEGYYDLPRRATVAELSDRLGVSRRSLADRLRRAERQLVETVVANERTRPRG